MLPADTPVNTPEAAFMEPIADAATVQVPPVDALDKVMLLPAHTDVGPVIAPGALPTVMAKVVKHPPLE